tara:strand:+ start:1109 stop:1522 length:414 start_codon:yes stop_codon:yes gene_type:complete
MIYEGEKECTLCGKYKFISSDKNLSEFNHNGKNTDGSPRFQSNCKPCHLETNKKNRRNLAYNIFKIRADLYHTCEHCGLEGWKKMQFHHPSAEDKLANPTDIKNLKKWQIEVEKCIVLCASCHQELHFNERHPELEL